MGKVYDALRRAEEQRARNLNEVASTPATPPVQRTPAETSAAAPLQTGAPHAEAAAPIPLPRQGIWARWFQRKASVVEESAAEFNKRRIALLQPESFVAEQFRSLRARINSIAATKPVRSLAVTSSRAGEGKTLSALSLAVVSAMSVDRRVLLVDCDLRMPAVHRSLGLRPDAGLAEVLAGEATAEEAIVSVDGTKLEVLPVRKIPPNPAELLGSPEMAKLLETLIAKYDLVILDLPCTLGLPDAKTVSELCDGIIFVVRADRTPEEDVAAAIEILDRRRVLGVVLNGADQSEGYGPYHRSAV